MISNSTYSWHPAQTTLLLSWSFFHGPGLLPASFFPLPQRFHARGCICSFWPAAAELRREATSSHCYLPTAKRKRPPPVHLGAWPDLFSTTESSSSTGTGWFSTADSPICQTVCIEYCGQFLTSLGQLGSVQRTVPSVPPHSGPCQPPPCSPQARSLPFFLQSML